jgi:hypothetical protein
MGIYMSNFARKHLAPVQGKQVAAVHVHVDAYEVPETRPSPRISLSTTHIPVSGTMARDRVRTDPRC